MTPNKIADLEKLLAEKNTSGAKALLKELLAEKMTSEERGEALVNIAALYLDITNSINKQYAEALKEAFVALKEVGNQEVAQGDAEKLKKIREELK
ncbi:MAG: hypothetical protein AAB610_01845 [Patescibacteria group bacterium]